MMRPEPTRPLTTRELQVVALVARGWANKRIAMALQRDDGEPVKPATVKAYIERIAAVIPNNENLPAKVHVMLWARDRHAA